jgi:hypothetical protein
MTRVLASALVLTLTGPALGQTLTCETSGDHRHCFDHHSYVSTEERTGDCVPGWDGRGRA